MIESTKTATSRAWAEINLAALRANIKSISTYIGPGVHIMAVVKADAYGHGLLPVARASLEAGCSWLGVATVQEAIDLREAGISAPIALLAPALASDAVDIIHNKITSMVGDRPLLDALSAQQDVSHHPSPISVHLDIDTGMGRSGVLPADAVDLWRYAISLGITLNGLSTHFADADGEDPSHTRLQQAEFERARSALLEAGAEFEWIHLDNSASTLSYGDLHGNMVRPGLLIYGITPTTPERAAGHRSQIKPVQEPISLTPVLSLKARVAVVRDLPKGHAISYGATHRLQRNSRVATVLIGYGDGYPRALSNRGHMLLHGKRALILGRICMDQTVIDVTDIPEAAPGDEAVCIGKQGANHITVELLTTLTRGTEHEITTGLTARVARVYTGL